MSPSWAMARGDAGYVALGDVAGGLGGEVAGGEAGATGRQDHVRDGLIAPGCELHRDAFAVVGEGRAGHDLVAALAAAALDEGAAFVDARTGGDAVGGSEDRDARHRDSLARPLGESGGR